MTLANGILFPGALLPLYIFEPRYRRMLADVLTSNRMFGVAMQKPNRVREIPSTIAGLGLVRVAVTRPNKTSYLILQGLTRIELQETVQTRPYRKHRVRPLPTLAPDPASLAPLADQLRDLVSERLQQGLNTLPVEPTEEETLQTPSQFESLAAFSLQHFMDYLKELEDPGQMADLVSCTLLSSSRQRQAILETVELKLRLEQVIHFLMAEIRRKRK